jgi:glycosyl transferase family 25
MEFPKTYVINMDKDTERLRKVIKQLDDYDISNYERIQGVNGKELTESELESGTTNFCKEYCIKSSIGCAMSHIKVYKKIIDNNDSMALILEDDVVFEDNFKSRVIEKLKDVPDDFDIVYLGCNQCNNTGEIKSIPDIYSLTFKSKYKNINESIFVPRMSFALHAYIVSNNGAKKLLEMFKDGIYAHIDLQIQNERTKYGLNVYVTRPLLAYQDINITNTSSQTITYPYIINKLFGDVYDEYRIPYSYNLTIPLYSVKGLKINGFNGMIAGIGLVSGITDRIWLIWLLGILYVYEMIQDDTNTRDIIESLCLSIVFYIIGVVIRSIL